MKQSLINRQVGQANSNWGLEHAKPKTQNPKLKTLPLLLCLLHFFALAYLARQHPIGAYATETDFYHLYAPDAERIAAGQFPDNTFQGPGYPAVLALTAKLVGKSSDLFTVGKWLSVVCAVACGWLVFVLFGRLFGFWVGLGAQSLAMVSGEWLTFSINATTDVFFLLLCLAVLVAFVGERLSPRGKVMVSGLLTGAAYVTRYNGMFLLVACLFAILLLNLFAQGWKERALLAAIFLGAFALAAAPWLYANYKHTGSPVYNTNYLNMATEFYPELVAGKTNQDATRALEERFHSFGEVLRYNTRRLLAHYPVNLWESLRRSFDGGLVHPLVAWLAALGIVLVLFERRSKAAQFVLLAGALYFLLMGLNHWETRYYFFVMALYAGFAVSAVERICRFVFPRLAVGLIPAPLPAAAIVILLFVLSVKAASKDVKEFLATQPLELLAARSYLNGVGAGKRLVARKPHLAYLTRNEWVFFPPVKSLDEFRAWVEANHVDYIAIGKRELKERKELKALGDPANAPAWLKAVWENPDPMFVLYQPQPR